MTADTLTPRSAYDVCITMTKPITPIAFICSNFEVFLNRFKELLMGLEIPRWVTFTLLFVSYSVVSPTVCGQNPKFRVTNNKVHYSHTKTSMGHLKTNLDKTIMVVIKTRVLL